MAKKKIVEQSQAEVNEIGTYEYTRNAYTIYGKDISWDGFQLGRQFCGSKDGLKISYRHLLQTLIESPDKLIKVQSITSDCMKKYHFHGDAAMAEVLYSLANDYGMVEVQGNSGSRTMSTTFEGAAGRYPEAKLKPEIREQLTKLMVHVPDEITVSGWKEKQFIPTPIPLGLVAGSATSMGVGMRNTLPAFTAQSMYNAAKKNDPSLLRLNYGYSLGNNYFEENFFDNKTNTICKGKDISSEKPTEENIEQLKELWSSGRGKLRLYIPIYNCVINNQQGFMLVCDPALFKPKKSKKLLEWESEGYIEIFDYSDEIGKLFVHLNPRVKKLTQEELKHEVLTAKNFSWSDLLYEVNVGTENMTGPVGIYNWIQHTTKNFVDVYRKYIDSELEKLSFEEICWYNIRTISDLLLDKKKKYSDKDIVKIVNDKLDKGTKKDKQYKINEEHAAWCGEKPTNTLRNVDPEEKLRKIEEMRKKYNSISIDDEIKKYIKCLSDK